MFPQTAVERMQSSNATACFHSSCSSSDGGRNSLSGEVVRNRSSIFISRAAIPPTLLRSALRVFAEVPKALRDAGDAQGLTNPPLPMAVS